MGEAAHADILFLRVNDRGVARELAADAGIDHALVRHEVRGAVNVGNDQAAKVLRVDVGDVEAANVALALDQSDNGLLGRGLAGGAVLGLAADIGFIGLDKGIRAAERGAVAGHGFTDAVRHEPSRLVCDAEHTMQLVRAHALLASSIRYGSREPTWTAGFSSAL